MAASRFLGRNQMALKVSEKTVNNTTQCTKGFSCLSGERGDLCMVGVSLGSHHAILKCVDNQRSSTYWTSFEGAEGSCLCPTRIEIYQRYGI